VAKGSNRRYATHADYQQVFGSDVGERVLWHLMKSCGMLVPTMSMTKPDALAMAFNEGRRSVALDILRAVSMDIKKLEKLMKKQQQGEQDEALLE
jgi:hypothetical protein